MASPSPLPTSTPLWGAVVLHFAMDVAMHSLDDPEGELLEEPPFEEDDVVMVLPELDAPFDEHGFPVDCVGLPITSSTCSTAASTPPGSPKPHVCCPSIDLRAFAARQLIPGMQNALPTTFQVLASGEITASGGVTRVRAAPGDANAPPAKRRRGMYPKKTEESWQAYTRRQAMQESLPSAVTVQLEEPQEANPHGLPISWEAFQQLGRDQRRSTWKSMWKRTRPQGFWPEGTDWPAKDQDAITAWSRLKDSELEMDIERWFKAGVGRGLPGRKVGSLGAKLKREGVKGCIRTYAIRLKSCPPLENRIRKVREMDVESQEFEDAMQVIRNHPLVRQKIRKFHEWNQDLVSVAGISESTEAFEVSMDKEAKLFIGAHAVDSLLRRCEGPEDVWLKYNDVRLWSFENAAPDFSQSCTDGHRKGRHFRHAIEDVHYYLQMRKTGWVWVWTNFEVRKQFTGRWKMLQQQLQKGKISIKQVRREVALNAEGTVTAVNFLKVLSDERQTQRMQEKYLNIRKMVAQHMNPWKPDDVKFREFKSQLPPLKPLDGSLKRFKVLIVCGPTRCAKTLCVRDFYGAERTLIVNCKGTTHPNLRDFVDQLCIVWDEADAEFVLANRGLLQSGIEGCHIQSSPTQVNARWVLLYGVAQVVTTNYWPDENAKDYDGWLRDNCIVRRVTEPLYEP